MSFLIDVKFEGSWAEDQKTAFGNAKKRWQQVIVARDSSGAPGTGADGLHITARIGRLDRKGGLSANTDIDLDSLVGPSAGRAAYLPTKATIVLDKVDLDEVVKEEAEAVAKVKVDPGKEFATVKVGGFLEDLLAHEIGHALGCSWRIWERKGLLKRNPEIHEPVFVGPEAAKAFGAALGKPPTNVPLETFGHEDEFLSHWRQAWFHSELMTFLLEDTPNLIGPITVGALKDLGYQVNPAKAETPVVNLRDSSGPLPEGAKDPALANPRHRVLRNRRWINCQVSRGKF